MKTPEEFLQAFKSLKFEHENFLPSVEALFKEGMDANLPDSLDYSLPSSALEWSLPWRLGGEDVLGLTKKYHELVSLFLRYGYDVKRNGGNYAQEIISSLQYTYHTPWLAKIVDALVSQGADPQDGSEDVIRNFYENGCWSESEDGFYVQAANCELLRRICGRATLKLPYDGITTYHAFLGKRVVDIKLVFNETLLDQWIERQIIAKKGVNARWYGTMQLLADDGTALSLYRGRIPVVDPYWKEADYLWGDTVVEDFPFYQEIIGQRLVDVSIVDSSDNKDDYGIEVKFENGVII